MKHAESDLKCFRFKFGLKLFSFGIVIGCLGGLFWQEMFDPLNITPSMDREQEISLLQTESQEKLLKYVEGRWSSSIGDLVIEISDSSVSGGFVVIENIPQKPKRKEKFKVTGIVAVDSYFGIVKLNLCKEQNICSPDQIIQIQINKVFGIENTITISFDKRIAFCIQEEEVLCTRSFKLIER